MRVKRRFSTRWGHPYHLQGACAKCRQTLLRPLCFITSMSPESYMEWPAQSKGEDPSDAIPYGTPWAAPARTAGRPGGGGPRPAGARLLEQDVCRDAQPPMQAP